MVRGRPNGSQRKIAGPAPGARSRRRALGAALCWLALSTVSHAGGPPEPAGRESARAFAPPSARAPAAPPPGTAFGPNEGERELAEARWELSRGELTGAEAERRAAYERARRHAARAVALLPSSAEARFALFGAAGRLAQLDGLTASAFRLFALNRMLDEVLRLDPDHADALAARGGMLVKLPRLLGGDPARGLAYLERSVALDANGIGKRLELAEAYHILGRDEEARRVGGQALERARRSGDPLQLRRCERLLGELEETCAGCALAASGD